MEYKLNLTPSPQDNRDFVFKTKDMSYSINYPEELDLRDELSIEQNPNLPKNIIYKPRKSFNSNALKSSPDNISRVFINLCRYYLTIPYRNYFRFLLKKPDYLVNNFIQRHSIFNKNL